MASEDTSKEDRQLEPSARKLEKARAEGQIVHSRDLGHFAVIGAAIGVTVALGPAIAQGCLELLRHGLRFSRTTAMDPRVLPEAFGAMAGVAAMVVAPATAILAVVAFSAAALPGGIGNSLKPLAPQFGRLNPASGFSRIFGTDNLIEFGKLLLLASILIAVGVGFGIARFPTWVGLGAAPLEVALQVTRESVLAGCAMLLTVLFFAATIDVPLQWWRHRVRLRMTHEEVREEFKQSEGDPQIKGRIRAKQREVAMARMMAAVPSADVIVTNPTHYAVAIRYDESGDRAPRVVAKGADHLAARIRELAERARVPMVEAPPLARALYARVEVDREIPEALYTAVAQILAYVFRLREWVPGRGPMPTLPQAVAVPPGLDPREAAR
jgi:flagellar biosynthetic protein FlhB